MDKKDEQLESARAGDIVGLAGFEGVYIGETLTDREERTPLQFVDIDPPTIRMRILVNDSPFAGRDGKFVTARHVRERLIRDGIPPDRVVAIGRGEQPGHAGGVMVVQAPPPPTADQSQSAGKFSYDRFGDAGKDEQVVRREEKPVAPLSM